MIEVNGIDVAYGPVTVLRQVSLTVEAGEIVALIGSNGAGKSTLIKAIGGLLPKRKGEISLDGRPITRLPSAEVARLGLAIVPAGRRLFGPLSVADNLRLGAYLRLRQGRKTEVNRDLDRVLDLFPRLRERFHQQARTLSGGEQQMVAIGRALMAAPRAILLDEPSIGLAPILVREIFKVIQRLREKGNTILLVEQNARMALKVADRAYVMEVGRVTLEGPADRLAASEAVERLYLGG